MGITKRAQYKVFNGTDFDVINFESEADYQGIYRQALINGNFDVWQRGTGYANPPNGLYLGDRWKIGYGSAGASFPNITHQRNQLSSGELLGSTYSYRISWDGVGTLTGTAFYQQLVQLIENGTRKLCGLGQKLTVSLYAKSSINGKRIGIDLGQNYGTGGTPSSDEVLSGTKFILTTSWQKFTFTFTTNTLVGKTFGTNNNDFLSVEIFPIWGSGLNSRFNDVSGGEGFSAAGYIDIAQVQINVGSSALPFVPKTFSEELMNCKRYFQKSYVYATAPGTVDPYGAHSGMAVTGGYDFTNAYEFLPVPMRVRPSVNIYNPASGTLGTFRNTATATDVATMALDAGEMTNDKLYFYKANGGLNIGQLYSWHWTADAEL